MSGESLERYFRMIRDDRQSRPSGRLWCPAADVYRSKEGWIVEVDLAGIKPADVEVTLDDDVLRISGSRRVGTCGGGLSQCLPQVTYSRFEQLSMFALRIGHASIQ